MSISSSLFFLEEILNVCFPMSEHSQHTQQPLDTLFAYGTLNEPYYLRLLIGRELDVKDGVLYGFRRIHPKSGYSFAFPWNGSKIEGSVLYGVTPEILQKLDEYESEGTLYTRQKVTVYIDDEQPLSSYVYIGNAEALEPYFKKGVGRRERIEAFIEGRVTKHLEEKAARYLHRNHEGLSLKVTQELLSEETHSLMREYFQEAGLPVFIIKHELENADIPNLDWVKYDSKALEYADEYIRLAVKFMIFNQIEERFRCEFPPYVKVSDEYYRHTISALMALKLLDTHYQELKIAMLQLSADRYDPAFTYVDYTVAAIYIARALYTEQRAKDIAEWVRANRRPGITPLGAELEFSRLGGRAVSAEEGEDDWFDSFYYFYDFDLMRRGWKLGAHIDDHKFLTTTHTRTRGFLELAFGRYKLLGDVSKPATQDPWILSQLIDLTIRYIGIRPHSLHVSLQTEREAPFRKLDNPEYLLCLMLLGGDLRLDESGKLREMRIYRQEIVRDNVHVHFSRLNRHHSSHDDVGWNFVAEYQFARLFFDYDYQPLLMALKGFQLGANPYPLKDCQDCPYEAFHRGLEASLIQWAEHPTPLSEQTLDAFMTIIEDGLEKEIDVMGSKYSRYAHRILGRIEEQLKRRNQRIRNYHVYSETISYPGN